MSEIYSPVSIVSSDPYSLFYSLPAPLITACFVWGVGDGEIGLPGGGAALPGGGA